MRTGGVPRSGLSRVADEIVSGHAPSCRGCVQPRLSVDGQCLAQNPGERRLQLAGAGYLRSVRRISDARLRCGVDRSHTHVDRCWRRGRSRHRIAENAALPHHLEVRAALHAVDETHEVPWDAERPSDGLVPSPPVHDAIDQPTDDTHALGTDLARVEQRLVLANERFRECDLCHSPPHCGTVTSDATVRQSIVPTSPSTSWRSACFRWASVVVVASLSPSTSKTRL